MKRFTSFQITLFLSFLLLTFLSLQAFSQDEYRRIKPNDAAVYLTAEVQSEPAPQITLNWYKNDIHSSYEIRKKKLGAASFPLFPEAEVDSMTTTWKDTDVEVGEAYEYEIRTEFIAEAKLTYYDQNTQEYRDTIVPVPFLGFGYIYAGIEAPVESTVGKVLLVVDETIAEALPDEIDRLKDDYLHDGWAVAQRNVPRAENFDKDKVRQTKDAILDVYNDDPESLRAVFLIGRVAVPYSGRIVPDGHTNNHYCAWPADMYYGVMDEMGWTDFQNYETRGSRPEHENIAGDGKFDNSLSGGDVDLYVGRIDFYNMPAFEETEVELIKNYLDKDHNYRMGDIQYENRAIIDDNFKGYVQCMSAGAWRSMATLVGYENIVESDFIDNLKTDSYLWSYGSGGGTYTSAGGIGRTVDDENQRDFVHNDINSVFTMLFGSYFGDWDSQNNFMRAVLCTKPSVLTCAWSGFPQWYFHHMGLGLPIGHSTMITQNNRNSYYGIASTIFGQGDSYYTVGQGLQQVHVALMGDPTLKMNTERVPMPENLSWEITLPDSATVLKWEEPEIEGKYHYNVYYSHGENGPWMKVNEKGINDTQFMINHLEPGSDYYFMVNAAKLVETLSGTYFQSGRGAITEATVYTDIEELISGREISIMPNPAVEYAAIEISSPAPAEIKAAIYDSRGNMVISLAGGYFGGGVHRFDWKLVDSFAQRVAAGIYFAKISIGEQVYMKKIVVMP